MVWAQPVAGYEFDRSRDRDGPHGHERDALEGDESGQQENRDHGNHPGGEGRALGSGVLSVIHGRYPAKVRGGSLPRCLSL